jgi:N-acetylglucosamine kinase-like BadF-type ATPase
MSLFLGVDGGGSKTEFVLVDGEGRLLARHHEGSAYYLETGLDALRAMLARGLARVLADAGLAAGAVYAAFFGLPAYGEDRAQTAALDAIATPGLPRERTGCDNDMVCAWAGALGGGDGINVVCGTGSIAYGRWAGQAARAGGWGELFGDEGSAYWVAREALGLFSRMSDGRLPRGPLHEALRRHYGLEDDLDLCAHIYGSDGAARSRIAGLARHVAGLAQQGDAASRAIFARGAAELAALVRALRARLQVPAEAPLAYSCTGSLFRDPALVLQPLRAELEAQPGLRYLAPQLSPAGGAALLAARHARQALAGAALARLRAACPCEGEGVDDTAA